MPEIASPNSNTTRDGTIRHFEKYKKLPKSLADSIIGEVLAEGIYHSVNADLLNLLYGRIDFARITRVADFAYPRSETPTIVTELVAHLIAFDRPPIDPDDALSYVPHVPLLACHG